MKVASQKSYHHMAITPSMERVMNVNVWDHVQMRVRGAALAAVAGGIVGCTAHTTPSTALPELPLAGLSAFAANPGGALVPHARTDGSVLFFDDQNRAVRLANFALSDRVSYHARPWDLVAPIGTRAEFHRLLQRGPEEAVLRLPWVQALTPLASQLRAPRECPDRTSHILRTYYLDHAFDLSEAGEQSMKGQNGRTSMLADDTLYIAQFRMPLGMNSWDLPE
jgi:hypothetical protein